MASVGSPRRVKVKTEKMQHFLEKHGDTVSLTRLLKCPKDGCDKVLTSSPGLRYHMKSHSDCINPYVCVKCKKTFKSSNGLKYHMDRTQCEEPVTSSISRVPDVSPNISHCLAMQSLITHKYTSVDLEDSLFCTEGEDSLPADDTDPIPSYKMLKNYSIPSTLSINVEQPIKRDGPKQKTNESDDNMCTKEVDWLRDLADIATGPQSPLLQRDYRSSVSSSGSLSPCKSPKKPLLERSLLHSYAKAPKSPSPDRRCKFSAARKLDCDDDSDSRVTSSSPFPSSPLDDYDHSGSWSHSWPTALWQCFTQGSRIRFTSGSKLDWQDVEYLAATEHLASTAMQEANAKKKCYAPNGLRVLHIEECKSVLRLQLTPDIPNQAELTAECNTDHPFFVRDKGWSSFHPSMSAEHYGIPCCELEVNDVCLPPSHPSARFTNDVFRCYDFTPEDSSAVFALSSMAQKKTDQDLSPRYKPYSTSKKKSSQSVDTHKAKRPMNAFMLFAKKYRIEYTQKYPGKDNRAISVILGDRWKKLKNEERKIYSQEAKQLADLHKRIHPDCWKRKRSSSESFEMK